MVENIAGPYRLKGLFVVGPNGFKSEAGSDHIGRLLVADLNVAYAHGLAERAPRAGDVVLTVRLRGDDDQGHNAKDTADFLRDLLMDNHAEQIVGEVEITRNK